MGGVEYLEDVFLLVEYEEVIFGRLQEVPVHLSGGFTLSVEEPIELVDDYLYQ